MASKNVKVKLRNQRIEVILKMTKNTLSAMLSALLWTCAVATAMDLKVEGREFIANMVLL
jgi:hypothetical protein